MNERRGAATPIFYRRYTIHVSPAGRWRWSRWQATITRGLMEVTPAPRTWRSRSRDRLVRRCVRFIQADAIKYTMASPQIRVLESGDDIAKS